MESFNIIEIAPDDLYNGKRVGDMTEEEKADIVNHCKSIGITRVDFVERHKPFYIHPEDKVRLIQAIQEIAARMDQAGKSPALVSRRDIIRETDIEPGRLDMLSAQLEQEGRIRVGRLINDIYYQPL